MYRQTPGKEPLSAMQPLAFHNPDIGMRRPMIAKAPSISLVTAAHDAHAVRPRNGRAVVEPIQPSERNSSQPPLRQTTAGTRILQDQQYPFDRGREQAVGGSVDFASHGTA